MANGVDSLEVVLVCTNNRLPVEKMVLEPTSPQTFAKIESLLIKYLFEGIFALVPIIPHYIFLLEWFKF